MNKRAVVTGIGAINSLGCGVDTFWRNLLDGKNGIHEITAFDASGYNTTKAAQVNDEYIEKVFSKRDLRSIDRFALFGILSAEEALKDAGLTPENVPADRAGVIQGSGMGGMLFYENQIAKYYDSGFNNSKVNPNAVQKITPNALSGRIAMHFGLQGPNLTISTACSSSNNALAIAAQHIENGLADIILSGGAEAPILPVNYASFDNMRVMSRNNICRPFDSGRDGFIMGEGAATLVIEELSRARSRDATIYGEIIGYANNCGAYHMVKVREGGEDEAMTLRLALKKAGISPEEVDYLSAHGTGTVSNDVNEAIAIRNIFGRHADEMHVSSIKGAVGHQIGASGATEAVSIMMAFKDSVIPPNANLMAKDPACEIVVNKKPVEKNMDIAISNSFGFGNNNAVLVFRKKVE